MIQHRIKRTDQKWFDLINDCQTSGLKVKTWCEQHDITAKALYYHTRQLRQKGYALSKRIAGSSSPEKQEVVCLDVSNGISADALPHSMIDANHKVEIEDEKGEPKLLKPKQMLRENHRTVDFTSKDTKNKRCVYG